MYLEEGDEQVLIQFRAEKAPKQEAAEIYKRLWMALPVSAAVKNMFSSTLSQLF